ncbi:MAG: hypothetical protein BYD32DRAFT_439830 [Podila humilis]|nr:MAG: hypothetical protein BYD32DRAFT_439830 [Podila humilis]
MCGDVVKEVVREEDEEQVEGGGDNTDELTPVGEDKGSCEAMSGEEEVFENAMVDVDDDDGTIFVQDSKIGWGDKAWPVFFRDVDPLPRVCRDETLRLLLSLLRGLMRVPVAPVVLGFVAVITPVVVADGDGIVRVLAAIVSAPVLFVDLNGTACCFVGFVGSASVGSVGKPLASCWMSPMAEKSTSDSLNRPVTPSQKPYSPLKNNDLFSCNGRTTLVRQS